MTQPTHEQTESTVRQFKEFLTQYNKLSEACFFDCITDFTTRKITTAEETCSFNCLEKFLKVTQRISQRFQEHQIMQSGGSVPESMVKR